MHHYHVSHRGVAHTFEVHGDYQIDADGYCPACSCLLEDELYSVQCNSHTCRVDSLHHRYYSRTLPDGGCYVADDHPMYLQVQVNDVQLDGGGSAMGGVTAPARNSTLFGLDTAVPVEWYMRIVFELAPKDEPCELLHKIVTAWPMTDFSRVDVYSRCV
jgi:hypothetical protein